MDMRPDEVPNGPLVLDTGAFSAIVWKKDDHEAYAALAYGHPFVLSFATVGELRAGAPPSPPRRGQPRRRPRHDEPRGDAKEPLPHRLGELVSTSNG